MFNTMENNVEYKVTIKRVYSIPFGICLNKEEAIQEASELFVDDLAYLKHDDFIYEVEKLYNSKLEARVEEIENNEGGAK